MARPPWTTPASSASSSGPSFERVPGKNGKLDRSDLVGPGIRQAADGRWKSRKKAQEDFSKRRGRRRGAGGPGSGPEGRDVGGRREGVTRVARESLSCFVGTGRERPPAPDLLTRTASGSRPTKLCYEKFAIHRLVPERTEVIFCHVARIVRGVGACGGAASHDRPNDRRIPPLRQAALLGL